MRLLFVCTSHSVFGAEILTLSLMRELRERGHELMAVVSLRKWSDGDFHQRLEAMGVPYVELPLGVVSKALRFQSMVWTLNCLIRQPITWWRYTRLTRRFSPDAIILTSPRHGILLWPLLDPRRTLLYVHSIFEETAWARRVCRWLDRRLAGYVAVSDFIGRNVAATGVSPEKIAVVKNGLLDDRACRVKDPQAARLAQPVCIGIVGQIGPWKGHDDLVEAAALLLGSGVDLRVRVFGTGEAGYVEQLKSEIARRGMSDRFEWMGFERDPAKIYRAFDICAMPSRFEEPFGLVAVEAGAAGLPVVATRQGGLPEIVVDGESGFLVAPECPTELAERLGRLLSDPELRRSMGERGRERVWSRFTRGEMADAFEQVCRRLDDGAQPSLNGGAVVAGPSNKTR